MKITQPDVIRRGERELMDSIIADLDWKNIEKIFKEKHNIIIEDDIEYKKGDIVIQENQVAYELNFEVKLSLTLLCDRQGKYLSVNTSLDRGDKDEQSSIENDLNHSDNVPDYNQAQEDSSVEEPTIENLADEIEKPIEIAEQIVEEIDETEEMAEEIDDTEEIAEKIDEAEEMAEEIDEAEEIAEKIDEAEEIAEEIDETEEMAEKIDEDKEMAEEIDEAEEIVEEIADEIEESAIEDIEDEIVLEQDNESDDIVDGIEEKKAEQSDSDWTEALEEADMSISVSADKEPLDRIAQLANQLGSFEDITK